MPAPDAPTSVTAVPGSRRATVSFMPPENDGGFVITGYTVTAVDETTPGNGGQTATGTNPPIAVTELTEGDLYNFTVTATNSAGTSVASAASPSVEILDPSEPYPPTGVSAIAGDGQATVSFSAPADNGGEPITGYEVTAVDETNPPNGGQTATGASSPIVVTGLSNGDGYTFQVAAINSIGVSPLSGKSSFVIPQATGSPDTPAPPFPNALDFTLEKPVNLVQLQDEISNDVGLTVQASVAGNYDPAQPISPTNPATLWVAPDTVSSAAVAAVLAAHVPNPAYGMSISDSLFQSALGKVLNDHNATLTADELQAAVRGLLLRSTLPTGTPLS